MSNAQDTSAPSPDLFSPMRWEGSRLGLLDQTRLPVEEVWLACDEPEQVADAIRCLAVRGAPAIGVAAAYGLVLGMQAHRSRVGWRDACQRLRSSRPTAV